MGLLSKLFGGSSGESSIERKLEADYVGAFEAMGMPTPEAKKMVAQMLQRIKEDYVREGMASRPANYGDWLLEQEWTNQEVKAALDRKRGEGVKDADVRWWWNMHYYERRMMVDMDGDIRAGGFLALLRKGLVPEQAAKEIKKSHVDYGDPDDPKVGTGEDRALPVELKDRINVYLRRRQTTDPERYLHEFQAATSMNAFVRSELRKGKI